jgi:hypothetical protein
LIFQLPFRITFNYQNSLKKMASITTTEDPQVTNAHKLNPVAKAESFQFLISQWKKQQHPLNKAKLALPRSHDVVIGARIRPILPKEADEWHVQGVERRRDPKVDKADMAAKEKGVGVGVVDIHQLVLGYDEGPRMRVCYLTRQSTQL